MLHLAPRQERLLELVQQELCLELPQGMLLVDEIQVVQAQPPLEYPVCIIVVRILTAQEEQVPYQISKVRRMTTAQHVLSRIRRKPSLCNMHTKTGANPLFYQSNISNNAQ